MDKEAWRAVIFFFTEKGNNAKETHDEVVAVFGDRAPSYSTVVKWAAEWRRGGRSIEDAPRSGRPSNVVTWENTNRVKKIVEDDRRIIIDQISDMNKISHGSVSKILDRELQLRKLSNCWVPKILTSDEKMSRLKTSKKNLQQMKANRETFFDRIVTQDETWIHHLHPETNQQSTERQNQESDPPRKFKKSRRSEKAMASIFWDCKGVIMIDYVEKGKKLTGRSYADMLVRLRECIKQKRRGLLTKGVLLLHDNVPVHTSQVALRAASNCGFEILDHPQHSPDLFPSDYYLFPNMKNQLRTQLHDSDDDVIDTIDKFLEKKDEEYFKNGTYKLEDRWSKCVTLKGDFIEDGH